MGRLRFSPFPLNNIDIRKKIDFVAPRSNISKCFEVFISPSYYTPLKTSEILRWSDVSRGYTKRISDLHSICWRFPKYHEIAQNLVFLTADIFCTIPGTDCLTKTSCPYGRQKYISNLSKKTLGYFPLITLPEL